MTKMKITVSEIPPSGLDLHERYDAREWDIERPDVVFKTPVDVEAHVTKAADEVFAVVQAHGVMDQECGRCLAHFDVPMDLETEFAYEVKGVRSIDISEDVRQEIMLGYSLKIVCRDACKGFCPVCGQNRNDAECSCNRKKEVP